MFSHIANSKCRAWQTEADTDWPKVGQTKWSLNLYTLSYSLAMKHKKIVAAFRGMHVSPVKHSFGKCDRRTDGQTDRRTTDKVIPMCRYASQATQKPWQIFSNERHWSHDRKIDFDFFLFLGVICHFSINIRLEVHFKFLVCIGKWKDTGC